MSFAITRTLPPLPQLLAGLAVGATTATFAARYFIQKADADSGRPTKVFGVGPAFVWLPLDSCEYVSGDTKRLRFALPRHDSVSGLALTSAVLTVSWPKGRWLPVARPYTPITSQDENGFLELLVKKYPDGKQSTHLHSLVPGEKLLFAAAIPGFRWKANYAPRVTLIAGGAGITPIFQLAQGILGNPTDETKITLIHGINTEHDMVLKRELDDLTQRFPGRLKVVYTVSQPEPASSSRKGRVTSQLIQEVAGPSDDHVFISGPPAMEEALLGTRRSSGILESLGYSKDRIHKF